MIVKDITTKKTICKEAKLASSLKDKLFGLLITQNPRYLIFKTRFGIHTFGLKEPIDVIVLDKNNKVIKLKSNLMPNRIFFWNPKYSLIIELPQTKIAISGIGLGSQLALIDDKK